MSSRLTKKSLVSVSGRLVKTPCVEFPGICDRTRRPAADENRHLRRSQRQQLRPIHQQLLSLDRPGARLGAEILLLDRPTANADLRLEMDIFELLKDINRHATIIVVSHDIGFVPGASRASPV